MENNIALLKTGLKLNHYLGNIRISEPTVWILVR